MTKHLLLPALLAAVVISGCGGSSSDITQPRLERSMEQSFVNRYVAQARLLGHEGVSTSSLHPHAYCDKGGPGVADHGPGADWNCYLTWTDPNVPLTDGSAKFEMNVHSNGCYTAGGPSRTTGLITLTDTHGTTVDNPVFEWDGCFDPTGSNAPNLPPGTPATATLPATQAPVDAGVVEPEITCSGGAAGGCIGTLTAEIGGKTVASTTYQLPPNGDNSFSFPVPNGDRAIGTKVTLTARPFVGKVAQPTTTVSLTPPPPE